MTNELKNIELGAASIFIELKKGKITVRHGNCRTILKQIDNCKAGSWDKIWNSISNIESIN
ncbi:MAG: hypothetical protein H8E98_00805 [Bacteroidetes bacterium]|nr:hypothetical protein [Bacteroidota bacterium]